MALVVLVIMMYYPAGVLADDGNIMVNPSFEQVPAHTVWMDHLAVGHRGRRDRVQVEEGDAHSGNRFVTIINNKENDARLKQVVRWRKTPSTACHA